TSCLSDWSSDVCSSDLLQPLELLLLAVLARLARDRLAQLVRQLVDVQSFEQRPHRRRADVGLERRIPLGLRLGAQLEEPVLVERSEERRGGQGSRRVVD